MDAFLWALAVAMVAGGIYAALHREPVLGAILILLAVLVGPGGAQLTSTRASGVSQKPVENTHAELQGGDGHTLVHSVEQR